MVCQLVKTISFQLSLLLPQYIKLPNADNIENFKRKFYNIAQFPGVVGCIDCTHIPIQNPHKDGGEIYRNRKGIFSINVQVIGGPDGEILDIVTRWPGSAHDSRIFENSSAKMKFDSRTINGLLLGDNGYAQSEYLFTPVLNPVSNEEQRYNAAHIATRTSIERLFGVWKRRFPCLSKKLANKLLSTTYIITACAVLHNIGKKCNEPDIDGDDFDADQENYEISPITNTVQRGAVIKQTFIKQHFKNK